jgi:hypothetical protein
LLILIVVSWGIYIPLTLVFIVPWIFNAQLNFALGVFFLFLIMYYFRNSANSNGERLTKTIIVFLPVFFFSLFYIIRGRNSWVTMPNYLVAPVIGMVSALFCERFRIFRQRLVIVLSSFILCSWIILRGFFIWGYLMSFGCLGTVYEQSPVFKFERNSSVLTNPDFKGKVSVIYFWNASCDTNGISNFNKLYLSWKSHPKIKFLAVKVSLDGDSIDKIIVNKPDYTFDNYIWKTNTEYFKVFIPDSVPKVVVINKKGRVVYKGGANKFDDVINRVLLE